VFRAFYLIWFALPSLILAGVCALNPLFQEETGPALNVKNGLDESVRLMGCVGPRSSFSFVTLQPGEVRDIPLVDACLVESASDPHTYIGCFTALKPANDPAPNDLTSLSKTVPPSTCVLSRADEEPLTESEAADFRRDVNEVAGGFFRSLALTSAIAPLIYIAVPTIVFSGTFLYRRLRRPRS
jgi:hypothetical protein